MATTPDKSLLREIDKEIKIGVEINIMTGTKVIIIATGTSPRGSMTSRMLDTKIGIKKGPLFLKIISHGAIETIKITTIKRPIITTGMTITMLTEIEITMRVLLNTMTTTSVLSSRKETSKLMKSKDMIPNVIEIAVSILVVTIIETISEGVQMTSMINSPKNVLDSEKNNRY